MKQVMAACVYHQLPLSTSLSDQPLPYLHTHCLVIPGMEQSSKNSQHCIVAVYCHFPENSGNEEISINIHFRFTQDKQVVKMKPMKSLENKLTSSLKYQS